MRNIGFEWLSVTSRLPFVHVGYVVFNVFGAQIHGQYIPNNHYILL